MADKGNLDNVSNVADVEFTIGNYTLEVHPGGRYWIRNKEGEGSEVSRESVEKMFKRLFEENFII